MLDPQLETALARLVDSLTIIISEENKGLPAASVK